MRLWVSTLAVGLAGCTCSAGHGPGDGDASPALDAAPADGGSPRDGAAPPPDGPARTSCVEALIGGSTGERCTFEGVCVSTDLCCGASADCSPDGLLGVRALACGGEPTTATCGGGVALVSGETPHGPIDLTRAWASYSRGFAVNLVLLLGTGAALTLCRAPRVGLHLSPLAFTGSDSDYVGAHEPVAIVTMPDAEPVLVPVTLEVTGVDAEGMVSATVRADHDGYRFEGEIVATDCRSLDRSGP